MPRGFPTPTPPTHPCQASESPKRASAAVGSDVRTRSARACTPASVRDAERSDTRGTPAAVASAADCQSVDETDGHSPTTLTRGQSLKVHKIKSSSFAEKRGK
jgi:hypothetical protein